MVQNGLPDEVLLLFTVLIWAQYFMIYISSPGNKVNQWCCICGFLLSVGVLKEYLYYGGIFENIEVNFLGVHYMLCELMNSILTAVLYYIAMPCVMIFSFYFCHLDRKRPRLFRILCVLVFIPVLIFGAVYPWSRTRIILLKNPMAFPVVSFYNLTYGVLATALILIPLFSERSNCNFRQRRLVSLIALLPLWYWLITLFLFHLLQLEPLYKVWQGNILILTCMFIYCIRHLFRDGIWGMRLNRVYFDWEDDTAPLPDNVRYIMHMLKNELIKLEWCSKELRGMQNSEIEPELDIIDRSVSHIREFVRQSGRYCGKVRLCISCVDMGSLLQDVAGELTRNWQGEISIHVSETEKFLCCDYEQMKEVLSNLVANALEAMGKEGKLELSYFVPRKNIALILVKDNGKGISEEHLSHIFEPYYTKGKKNGHMGLGLPFCRNVVKAHGGFIRIKTQCSPEKHGTTITICIPGGTKERRGYREREDKSAGC